MARTPGQVDVDALLSESDWLRRLATGLLHDRSDADDLVQRTWIAALGSPPEPGRPVRPWLATVLRNLIRMDARAAGRRRTREDEVAGRQDPSVTADAVLERLEMQRRIVALLQELDEPLRTALVLRFFEGRPGAAIAEAQGVPPGTVRWRISEGLRRLRQRLDEEQRAEARSWRALLLPLVAPEAPARPPAPAAVPSRLPQVALTAAAASAVGLAIWMAVPHARRSPDPSTAPAARAAPVSPSTRPRTLDPDTEERTMKNAASKTAALFGIVLPALVASAEGQKPLPREEAITFCVEQREWIVQKCKEDYADLMVSRTPPERREAARKEWLQKLEEGGSGPLPPRREKCAAELDKGAQLASISTYAGREAIQACQKQTDCKAALACAQKYMFGANAKR
jgi:RNA polymerase sigma factor (sigma-70 family)